MATTAQAAPDTPPTPADPRLWRLTASPDAPSVAPPLVRAVAVAMLAAAAATSAILLLANRPDWWKGLLGAAVVTALSAAASVPPLVWGLRRGLYPAVAGSFTAMGLRAIVALGAGIFVVKALHYPAGPTLLLLVVFYFAVLAAESYVVATKMWHMRG